MGTVKPALTVVAVIRADLKLVARRPVRRFDVGLIKKGYLTAPACVRGVVSGLDKGR